MANFEDENAVDDEGALQNGLRQLKNFEVDMNDLDFTFNQIETKMQANGVKKQYTKFQILADIIPKRVQDQVRPLLRKKETDLGNNAYKRLKTEILRIFSPREEADFERAMARVLIDTPSALARDLVNDLCQHELTGCCCHKFIVGLWKRQLPLAVRQATAHIKFNAENFNQICELADKVYAQGRPSGATAAGAPSIAAVQLPHYNPQQIPVREVMNQAFSEHFPTHPDPSATPEVAALARGGRGGQRGHFRGRGYRGQGRGGGRGGAQPSQAQQSQSQANHNNPKWPNLKRSQDNPPFSSCRKHWRFGKTANWCEEPLTCPWKNFISPKENN